MVNVNSPDPDKRPVIVLRKNGVPAAESEFERKTVEIGVLSGRVDGMRKLYRRFRQRVLEAQRLAKELDSRNAEAVAALDSLEATLSEKRNHVAELQTEIAALNERLSQDGDAVKPPGSVDRDVSLEKELKLMGFDVKPVSKRS